MFGVSEHTFEIENSDNEITTINHDLDTEDERLNQIDELLFLTKGYGMDYLNNLNNRKIYPAKENLENLKTFIEPIPENYTDPVKIIESLHRFGSPATSAITGRRYFGSVTGGSQPVALAANLLAETWDQNAALEVTSPVSAKIEEVVSKWLVEILPVPKESVVGFTSGVTIANLTSLAVARYHVLKKIGWDIQKDGLHHAPQINIVLSEEAHGSLLKALSILGFGRERFIKVPVDAQGRMRVGKFPEVDESTIVCLQAGNVNTGSFDPAEHLVPYAKAMGAWVHVDGAFGLWAGVSPKYSSLTKGFENADSWVTDAHRWLNVPYDSGIMICNKYDDLNAPMILSDDYLDQSGLRILNRFTSELSRRSRSIVIWAALKTLGKNGVIEMIERKCRLAELFAQRLKGSGFNILNEVKINQVIVSFGDSEKTVEVIKAIQKDGTCYCSSTKWRGETAMSISISSWATTEEDIELSAAAIIHLANSVHSNY
jgi:glutamate/tyrosine decarboxylase-like PLP-dependent enzyme